jgi:hypothetical protein
MKQISIYDRLMLNINANIEILQQKIGPLILNSNSNKIFQIFNIDKSDLKRINNNMKYTVIYGLKNSKQKLDFYKIKYRLQFQTNDLRTLLIEFQLEELFRDNKQIIKNKYLFSDFFFKYISLTFVNNINFVKQYYYENRLDAEQKKNLKKNPELLI